MKLAIFDFDGTVLDGNSWHFFFFRMLRDHPWRAPLLVAYLGLRRLQLISAHRLQERALAAWRGLSREEISARGRTAFMELLVPRIRGAALAEMERCRREGFEIVLLTGAFDFLIEPFAKDHGVRHWRATRLEYRTGVFTGRLEEEALRGDKKVAVLDTLLGNAAVDWHACRAYGDEESDLPVLRRVGHPFWVQACRSVPAARPADFPVVVW